LVLMVRAIRGTARPETAGPVEGAGLAGGARLAGGTELARGPGGEGLERRRFLIVGAGAAALGVAAGGLGNALLGRFSVASSRAAIRLPGPAVPEPAGMDFGPGCSSVPASGAGSFTGMATAPVATAASATPCCP